MRDLIAFVYPQHIWLYPLSIFLYLSNPNSCPHSYILRLDVSYMYSAAFFHLPATSSGDISRLPFWNCWMACIYSAVNTQHHLRLKGFEILRDSLRFFEILWDSLRFVEIRWDSLRFSRFFQRVQSDSGLFVYCSLNKRNISLIFYNVCIALSLSLSFSLNIYIYIYNIYEYSPQFPSNFKRFFGIEFALEWN